MKLSGEQLLFLLNVLKDSLDIHKSYAYVFNSSHERRKKFYEEFMNKLIVSSNPEVLNFGNPIELETI